MSEPPPSIRRPEGRYVVCDEIAAGGTATVHFGRLLGQGFTRTVAIKRLHPTYARDPVFVSMFLDEARLAARIRHPNVCSILDVVTLDDVPCLVLEYVHGDPMSRHIDAAVRKDDVVPFDVAAGIVCGMLHGLHAAHEATDELGQPLHMIHRDVSPQNVLVGIDGVPRVVDFGMAKATGRLQNTAEGQLKGKLGYMAPEQFTPDEIDRRVDVYSAGVVLWEALTGQFLFERTAPSALMHAILEGNIRRPSEVVGEVPAELDAVCMRALSLRREERYETAHDMAMAIEAAIVLPSPSEIGAWVERVAGDVLEARGKVLARIEREHSAVLSMPVPPAAVAGPAPEAMPDEGADSEPERREDEPRRSRAGLVSVVVVMAAVALIAYLAGRESSPTAVPGPPEPVPSAAAPTLPPQDEPAPEPTPTASASVPEPASSAPASPPARWAKPKPRPDCNPHYTIDKDGIRRPKRECLGLPPRP